MMKLIGFLLVAWLVITVVGLVVEGLFWLFAIGLILLLGTAAWGWIKRNV